MLYFFIELWLFLTFHDLVDVFFLFSCMKHPFIAPRCFQRNEFYFDIFVLSRSFLLNFHFYHFVECPLNIHHLSELFFFSRFWIIADYFELIIFKMSGVSFDANEIIQDLGFSASQLHRTSLVVGFACAYSFLYMGCSVASLIFLCFQFDNNTMVRVFIHYFSVLCDSQ